MKLISWNVNGIRAVMRKEGEKIMEDLNADVLCIQETKAQDDQVREALEKVDAYHVYSNSAERKGYAGTAILSKDEPNDIVYDMGIEDHDNEGRVMAADFGKFWLVNVYTPNSGNGLKRLDYRQEWDKDFREYVSKLDEDKPTLVCGDLNVCHQRIDIARPDANYNKSAGFTQKEIDGMDALLGKGFVDTWRSRHPDEVKYSWWSYRMNARAKNIGWRLDYFLASEKIDDDITDTFILNDVMGSDHCPVGVKIDLD